MLSGDSFLASISVSVGWAVVVGSDLLDVVTVPVGAAGVKGSFDGAMRPEVFFRGSVIVPYKIKDQLYSVPVLGFFWIKISNT